MPQEKKIIFFQMDFRQATDVGLAASDLAGVAQLLRQRPRQPLHPQQSRDLRSGHRSSRDDDDDDGCDGCELETRHSETKEISG